MSNLSSALKSPSQPVPEEGKSLEQDKIDKVNRIAQTNNKVQDISITNGLFVVLDFKYLNGKKGKSFSTSLLVLNPCNFDFKHS